MFLNIILYSSFQVITETKLVNQFESTDLNFSQSLMDQNIANIRD